MINPFEVKIHNQSDDEKVVKIWRRHRITLIKPTLRVLAFLIVPIILMITTGLSMFTSPWLFGIFLIIIAVSLTFAAYEWASWYGDVYVLTNYRIIDVDQEGFFNRKFAEASIAKIEDISYTVKGIAQTVFNYGEVLVQTAGAVENIRLSQIPYPSSQVKYILQQQEKYLDCADAKDMSAEELIKLLNKHAGKLDQLGDLEKEENMTRAKENLKKVKGKDKKKKNVWKKKQEADGDS